MNNYIETPDEPTVGWFAIHWLTRYDEPEYVHHKQFEAMLESLDSTEWVAVNHLNQMVAYAEVQEGDDAWDVTIVKVPVRHLCLINER